MSNLIKNSWSEKSDNFEESVIAILLGLMTLVTFANVIARAFNSNILWALEVTVFLFAWLVLFGISYGVKKSIHLGVDVVVNMTSSKTKKICAMVAVCVCLLFSLLLLKGSWDYWYPFVTKRAFLETEDVPMPEILQFMSSIFNDGERYENMPRFIPYFILPLGMSLLTLRYFQLAFRIFKGKSDMLIASHEAESDTEKLASDDDGISDDNSINKNS